MLPKQFRPSATYDLIRLGRDHDGGYLADPESVIQAKQLLSFGIAADWSFEKDFLRRNDVPLLAYDATISAKKLFRRTVLNLLRFRIRKLFSYSRVFVDYYLFFTGTRAHRRLNIGYDSKKSISLQTLFSKERPKLPVFIKMDIEGSEYRVLDDLLKYSSSISSLVVEFHDIDLHQEKILSFIQKFPLTLVHVHGNNCGQLVDSSGDLITIEFTFSKSPKEISSQPSIPHPLDQKNGPREEDIPLKFG